jgi:hypothetical protein
VKLGASLQERQRREGDMRREAARAVILLWGRSSDFPAQGGPFPVHGGRDRADMQHGKIGIPAVFPI